MRKLYSDEPIGIVQCFMPEFKSKLTRRFRYELEEMKSKVVDIEAQIKAVGSNTQISPNSRLTWQDYLMSEAKRVEEMKALISDINAIPNCDYEFKI